MPRLRVMPTPCLKATSEGAVIRTPWAPPLVAFFTASAGSPFLALTTKSAPSLLGVRELAVIDVDRADLEPHDLGVLNGKVSEAAGAGDDDPFAGLRFGLLDTLVGGDAGADERRGFLGVKAGWYMRDIIGIGDEVFGEAAILRVAAELAPRRRPSPTRSGNTRNDRTPSRARARRRGRLL